MRPETLKLIARAAGEYEEVSYSCLGKLVSVSHPEANIIVMVAKKFKGSLIWTRYDPENNAEQREEILLWLLGEDWKVDKCAGKYRFNRFCTGRYYEDYTTALLNAAEKEINQ